MQLKKRFLTILALIVLIVSSFATVMLVPPTPQGNPPRTASFPGQSPTAASQAVYWLGAQTVDSSVMPNLGVQAQIQVVDTAVEGTGCVSFWISESALSNGEWGQVGYYQCDSGSPVAFYQIWSLPATVLSGGSVAVTTGTHAFSMYVLSGTLWTFALDGVSFGQYNMGTTSLNTGYHIQALSEEQPPNNVQFAVPTETFPIAIQGMVGGKWVNASSATAFNSGGTWGLSAKGNSITFGGSVSPSTGTLLWSKGSTTTTTPTITTSTTPTSTATTSLPPTITATAAYTYTDVCPNLSYNNGNLVFSTGCAVITQTATTTITSTVTAVTTVSATSTSIASSASGVVCTSATTGTPSNKFAIGQSLHYIGSNHDVSRATFIVQNIYCGNQYKIYGAPYTGDGWSYWSGTSYFAEDMLAAG